MGLVIGVSFYCLVPIGKREPGFHRMILSLSCNTRCMADAAASSQQTIEALLDLSERDALPLARAFVQQRDQHGAVVPGPLSMFVRYRRFMALQQYLLFHAVASGGSFDVARDSRIWARAMDMDPRRASARAAVSKNWAWLEEHKLVRRARRGRLVNVTLLRDDGSGRPYDGHPWQRREPYSKLPYAFWRSEWHRKLDLASTAVLLIALSLDRRFLLPGDRVHAWYGISSATLTKGLRGLRVNDLISVKRDRRLAPLAPEGYTWEHRYTLSPPFHSTKRRRSKEGGK